MSNKEQLRAYTERAFKVAMQEVPKWLKEEKKKKTQKDDFAVLRNRKRK